MATSIPNPIPIPLSIQPLVSFLEHERAPMAVIAPDHTLLAVNTAYRRQFGVADRDCVGRRCYEVSHGFDAPCDELGLACPMRQAARSRASEVAAHGRAADPAPAGLNQTPLEIEVRPVLNDAHGIQAYVERLTPQPRPDPRRAPAPVGHGPACRAALSAVRRVAPSMLPVLLQGESGSGKELFARAVHDASPRRTAPFVVVDCSGLNEPLFESELFGYEKGAFTGALARKSGLVEAAQGGTLFLDEIGDVPLPMQVKLLRLIETGLFRRVGGIEQLQADFRLVCATHQPLAAMVSDGRFRQDLYFRISAFPVRLPALRERLEDLPEIVSALLGRSRAHTARLSDPITADALACLAEHDWPGNVRELRNVLDRAALYSAGETITRTHLQDSGFKPLRRSSRPRDADRSPGGKAPEAVSGEPTEIFDGWALRQQHGEAQPQAFAATRDVQQARGADLDARPVAWLSVAQQWSGSRADLARHLGWSERTLYRRLREAGLARALRGEREPA